MKQKEGILLMNGNSAISNVVLTLLQARLTELICLLMHVHIETIFILEDSVSYRLRKNGSSVRTQICCTSAVSSLIKLGK